MQQIILPDIKEQQSENSLLAHDLRNALCPILMYSQILESALSKMSLHHEEKTARMISNSVNEMLTMISARLESINTPRASV